MSKPLQQFHVGSDNASVFSNKGKNGEFLSARLNGRGYKNDEGDWQRSHNYGLRQLADHVALCQRLLNYMIDNQSAKVDEDQESVDDQFT